VTESRLQSADVADRGTGYKPWPVSVITSFQLILAGAVFLLGVTALMRASISGLISIAITDLFVFSQLRCCAIASTPNLSRQPHGECRGAGG
jgi:hypothetical protein